MSNQPQKPHPPQAPPNSPETWITAAETAAVLHLSLRTVLSRAASGKLPARIPDELTFTYDGKRRIMCGRISYTTGRSSAGRCEGAWQA